MRHAAFALTGLLTTVLVTQSSSADPTGIEYEVLLDAEVASPLDPTLIAVEGHLGPVTFDGLPDPVPNDIDPSLDFPGDGFLPGNELIVTEDITFNPDESETISIWIDAQDPAAPFPTPGAPLFANPVAPAGDDSPGFVVAEVGGLIWAEGPASVITDLSVSVSFPDELIEVDPLFVEILGSGTFEDPFSLFIDIDPADMYSPSGDFETGTPATDLHITFTVVHIPEPTAAALALLAMAALAVRR